MSEASRRLLPGTALPYSETETKAFARIELLITAAGGLSLSQVCSITGLEGSTIQNWVKRGWVSNPRGKKYDERQVARILIINALKECLRLECIAQLMAYVNGDTNDSEDDIISESELFNYLCEALRVLENAEDFSQEGVEAVVDLIVTDCVDETARKKLRKALAVMIYACVCTDVKRRTESMLESILQSERKTEELPVHTAQDNAPEVSGQAAEEREKPLSAQSTGEEKPVSVPIPRSLFFKRV